MSLKRIFRAMSSKVKSTSGDPDIVSIVLLLREPESFSEWEYAAAIEKSWGVSEQNHVVMQGPLAILKIDANLVQAICGGRPYWTSRKILPEWAHHKGFVTVDHVSPELDAEPRYAVIARLVLALLNKNCVAAFSPALGGLVRNDESLSKRLSATGWLVQNERVR